jgi:MarR family transcriptional regulator, 2-MHQ and catechol-resistance regulon repressor
MQVEGTAPKKIDATHVFLELQRTYRGMLALVEESKKKMGLGDSDFRVLEALFHNGPLPVNVIGQMIDLTTGSITSAVDRMEAKWLVVRKNHPDDRRIRLVELTAKGRRLIEKSCAQFTIDMEEAVSTLTNQERSTLLELLKRLDNRNEEGTVHTLRVAR